MASCFLASTAVATQGPSRDITVEGMRSERRVASVIGNGAYPTTRLRNPVNDARAIARTLREVGFEVLAHENLNQKEIRRAIIEFGNRLAEGGIGLIYFAGHGLQVASRNYMIPVDAVIKSEAEVEVESVDVASVLARMETAQNRLNIVILDACRDNPFGRSFRSSARGLGSIDAPAGTIIAYATSPGKLARDISVEAMRTEKRVALVIGNSGYPSGPLKNPVNDARAMAQLLHEAGVGLFYRARHGCRCGVGISSSRRMPSSCSRSSWTGETMAPF